jgi:hypothetical protein
MHDGRLALEGCVFERVCPDDIGSAQIPHSSDGSMYAPCVIHRCGHTAWWTRATMPSA